jgi:hypothetical protein
MDGTRLDCHHQPLLTPSGNGGRPGRFGPFEQPGAHRGTRGAVESEWHLADSESFSVSHLVRSRMLLVELRGLEPLTFSLRTRGNGGRERLQRLQPMVRVTGSPGISALGVHMGCMPYALHDQLGRHLRRLCGMGRASPDAHSRLSVTITACTLRPSGPIGLSPSMPPTTSPRR